MEKHVTILGGGPAGLAVAYFAQKNRLPFSLFEASDRLGGSSITLRRGEFLFDSGAHRFHDRDPEITAELRQLLGEDLREIFVPSQIYSRGRSFDFPLSPLNLILKMGPKTFFKAGLDFLRSKAKARGPLEDFERFARSTYGNTIAERFLLNYSEKLWGADSRHLSPIIAGNRMKGLNLKTFLTEAFWGRRAKTGHLDGSFYYPRKRGIGLIFEKLGEFCDNETIFKKSEISKIFHDQGRIQAVEINGKSSVRTDRVVSSLPLTVMLERLSPPPPADILKSARTLQYRSLVLSALFLNRTSITPNATVYFPDREFLFTRIYEPRNRETSLSPAGKTSLVAEIPCQFGDSVWAMEDDQLIDQSSALLMKIGWIQREDILGSCVYRIPYAYPILEATHEEHLDRIRAFLGGFSNLWISGRNAKFQYSHIHDQLRSGKEIVKAILTEEKYRVL